MKIGIYGGAFNPVHFGHLKTAEDVLNKLSLDKVIFIPAGNPPFRKPELAAAEDRFEMVKAAVEDRPEFEVSDIELRTGGKSYTIDTIEKLSRDDTELFLIIGVDAFKDMQVWKDPQKIFAMSNVVIISRPGYSFAGLSSSPYLKDVPEGVLQELDAGARDIFSFSCSKKEAVILCRVVAVDISSSHLREVLKRGEETGHLLPESVKSYIILHNLYKIQYSKRMRTGN
jgi:nicotinate-nucleotide adenylyltransferase